MSHARITHDSDAEYKELLKEWKKCFSRTRKLDYYFNARTNESLWTLDEVKERIIKGLKKSPDIAKQTAKSISSKGVNEKEVIQAIPAQTVTNSKNKEIATKTYTL